MQRNLKDSLEIVLGVLHHHMIKNMLDLSSVNLNVDGVVTLEFFISFSFKTSNSSDVGFFTNIASVSHNNPKESAFLSGRIPFFSALKILLHFLYFGRLCQT